MVQRHDVNPFLVMKTAGKEWERFCLMEKLIPACEPSEECLDKSGEILTCAEG